LEPITETGTENGKGAKPVFGPVVKIDEGRIEAHLAEVVRTTVEETLNALLDTEADQLCGSESTHSMYSA
jgi:hypothetical protein